MYEQHLQTLGCLKRDKCPKDAILKDSVLDIWKWQAAGKIVIVLTDFNKDMRSYDLSQFFSKFGLSEAITGLN